MSALKKTNKKATTISLDGKLLEAAKAEAKKQRRTLSAQLEYWMAERLTTQVKGAA